MPGRRAQRLHKQPHTTQNLSLLRVCVLELSCDYTGSDNELHGSIKTNYCEGCENINCAADGNDCYCGYSLSNHNRRKPPHDLAKHAAAALIAAGGTTHVGTRHHVRVALMQGAPPELQIGAQAGAPMERKKNSTSK